MRRPIFLGPLVVITALIFFAAPILLSAHHSSAMFDSSQSLTLRGHVKEFRWTNPHVFIQVLVEGDRGPKEEWSIEMSSPEQLAHGGWQPGTLKEGDAVSLVIHPMRNGAKNGQYVSGTGPLGPLIEAPPPTPVSSQTLSPGATKASCPRVEVTLVESGASVETRPVRLGEQIIAVRRDAITTTSDITEITVAGDDADTLISIKYTPQAAVRLLDATTDHDGVMLALVVDDAVWLAFTWKGPYGIGPEGTQVSIRHGLARAEKLIESIRHCTHPR
jgi:hypothetical protein